jgi:hypothetical protein
MRIKELKQFTFRDKLSLHWFFRWFMSNGVWDAPSFACWQCIDKYRHEPNKRKAIFIYDTFVAPVQANGQVDGGFDVLGMINLGGAGEGAGQHAGVALRGTVTNIKKVQHWYGKVWNWGLSNQAKYTRPGKDLFADLLATLTLSINDLLKRSEFVMATDYDYDARYTAPIGLAKKQLTEATFDPDAMGIW